MAPGQLRPALVLAALCVLAAAGLPASAGGFCAALRQALDAAEGADGLAAIAGPDTGLGHESRLTLRGAALCLVWPDAVPAEWSCVLDHETKYTIAQQKWNDLARSVESCLGAEWNREEVGAGRTLRAVEFRSAAHPASVRVMATLNVQQVKNWKGHRIVLTVRAPPAAAQEP